MLKRNTGVLISSLLCLSLSACSTTHHSQAVSMQESHSLSALKDLRDTGRVRKPSKKGGSEIRLMAIKETAMSLGAQSALAIRAEQINAVLERNARQLDRVFNFQALLMAHSVLPPILLEGRHTLHMSDPNTIRVSDKSFQIIKQAHFVTTAPNWRSYLWLSYPAPPMPDPFLLPKNAKERMVWREEITKAFEQGSVQADVIFADNLARLKRDYNGMLTYRMLLAQGMVSKPFVARTELGVTGGGNHMRVNDQVLRIVALPQLQANSHKWQPVLAEEGKRFADANQWSLPPISHSSQAQPLDKFQYPGMDNLPHDEPLPVTPRIGPREPDVIPKPRGRS